MLKNLGFEDPEVNNQKMFKKLFQRDYDSPSNGENQRNLFDRLDVMPLKDPLQQEESIVLKEEDEEKNYYIIKFE